MTEVRCVIAASSSADREAMATAQCSRKRLLRVTCGRALARDMRRQGPLRREALAQECLSAIFLESLLEAFHTAEDPEPCQKACRADEDACNERRG